MNASRRAATPSGLLIAVTIGTLMGLLSPNLAPFQIGAFIDYLRFDEQQVGLVTTAELLLVSIVALFSAPFLSRISCSRFAQIGAGISLIGQVATMYVDGYALILAARCIAGFGLGMVYGAANAAGAKSDNPARFFAIATTAALILLSLFMPVAAYLSSRYGYPAMYGAIASIVLLGTYFLKDLGTQVRSDAVEMPPKPLLWNRLWPLLLALALFNIGTGAVWTYFERSGLDLQLRADTVGFLAGIAALTGIAGSLAAGWVDGLMGRTAAVSAALAASGLACYLIASGIGPVPYAIGAVLYWVSYMFMYPFLIGIAATLDTMGRGSAIAAGTLMTSYSMGPLVASVLVPATSLQALAWLGLISCTGAAIVLVPLTRAMDRRARAA